MPRKKTKEEFIKEVNDLYGNTIDLSSFEFVNYQTKGLCKCTVCGYEWYVRPYSLVAGHGCRKCYDKRNSDRRTQGLEDIQERVHSVHPNVDIIGKYVNTRHKALCKCNICGNEWMVLPMQLLRGHGCPVCNGGTKTTSEKFIQKCQVKYGDKYNLSQMNFYSLMENITVICKKHGPFTIQAKRFLNRVTEACPQCQIELQNKLRQQKQASKSKPIKESKPKTSPKRKTKAELHQYHTERFMEKLQEVFKDKDYDFSRAVYVNSETKVDIICRLHGLFSAVPYSLLSGHGCPVCGNRGFYYKTSADWISRAKEKHPEFDYSKTEYINNKTKVTVICPIHGEISVWPKLFMSQDNPCSQCRIEKSTQKRSKDLWGRIEEIYRDKDYTIITSKDTTITSNNHIDVLCNKHNCVFKPSVSNILKAKCGCPQCGIERNADRQRLTLNEVIDRIQQVHGARYDFSLIREAPKNTDTKIPLICKKHGKFYTTIHSVSMGRGCPECGRLKVGQSLRLTQEEFLERVERIHLGKDYDWSKAVYVTNTTPVTVICNKIDAHGHIHGSFRSTPVRLMIGQECPKCNASLLEQKVRSALIVAGLEFEEQKRTKWLSRQSFDFYIPNKQIAIECQGAQHFDITKYHGRFQSDYEDVHSRDLRKARLAEENDVTLVYYLEPRFAKYMEGDEHHWFTNTDSLVEFIKKFSS